jgi:hypothetical protein
MDKTLETSTKIANYSYYDIVETEDALPEYRNLALCRVSYSLPSVLFWALGKELKKPSVKETLGEEAICRVFYF